MKRIYTVREKANEYTGKEVQELIELKTQMIESIQEVGLNKKASPWKDLPESCFQYAKNRYENSLIELENLKKILRYKEDIENILLKHQDITDEKAYFLWSFRKQPHELHLKNF